MLEKINLEASSLVKSGGMAATDGRITTKVIP